MGKNHSLKHKYGHENATDNDDRYRLKSKSEIHHHRRKHKKHKHKDDDVEYVNMNHRNNCDESPLRSEMGKVIEIHGSSSEKDSQNESDSDDCHFRLDDSKMGSQKHKQHRKEEKRHKKRRKRSRSNSCSRSRDRDIEYFKNVHKRSGHDQHRQNRNESDSDSDYQSANDHRKRKSREHSSNGSKENDSSHRNLGGSKGKIKFEGGKAKADSKEGEVVWIKKEPEEKQRRQSEPVVSRIDSNNHQEPSGSRGDGRRQRSKGGGDSQEWGGAGGNKSKSIKQDGEVQKPNFGLSGKLTEDTNTFNGVVIKYSEPPEARMPKKRWRLYPFKGDQPLPPLYIHRQSAYLLGRDRKVADMPIDHPSCSKQHAALQYRLITRERPDGTIGKQIRLYIIDLESANGTFINNKKIEPRKYVELFEKDVIKFGFSSREYVLLHEHSKDDDLEEA